MALEKLFTEQANEAFWSKACVTGADDCWEWTGALSPDGYGKFRSGYRGPHGGSAHRYSFLLHHSEWRDKITEKHLVAHECDNPCCVNPKHLFLTDHKGNTADAVKKGRMRAGGIKRHKERMVRKLRDEDPEHIAEITGLTVGHVRKILRKMI